MKKPVIVALVASLLSLGGALSLEAEPPASTAKAPAATSAAPTKAATSKKQAHHSKKVKHVKKSKATAHTSHPA